MESRLAANANFTSVVLVEGRLVDLFGVEQEILKEIRSRHFRADEAFEGRTETFLLTAEEEALMLTAITNRATLASPHVRLIPPR